MREVTYLDVRSVETALGGCYFDVPVAAGAETRLPGRFEVRALWGMRDLRFGGIHRRCNI